MKNKHSLYGQRGLSVWSVLVIGIIVIQWLYFAILSVALYVEYQNFVAEASSSVENHEIHGRYKKELTEYYLNMAQSLGATMAESDIAIERKRGVDKPSVVTLTPRFQRPFLFGLYITYQEPLVLNIPAIGKK